MAREVLGRGLRALLESTEAANETELMQLAVEQVRPNPYQPRQHFDLERLQELASSIKSQGVLQPIVVRRHGQDFELIAGERRLRAAQMAGCETIPAVVKDAGEHEVLALALLENLQREDLNPMEEARAYQRLQTEFHLRQEDVAQCVGKDRSTVANMLRLLKLSPSLQDDIATGRLSMGHARALLALESEAEQQRLRDQILAGGLSVRDTEAQVRSRKRPTAEAPAKSPYFVALESALQHHLGTRVTIRPGRQRGKIEIAYAGAEELQRLLRLLQLQLEATALPPSGPPENVH